MSDQQLIRRGEAQFSIELTPLAAELKNKALENSSLIAKVIDAATQETAVLAQQIISGLLASAEKDRKALKEPAIEYGRAIDGLAKAYTADLKEEEIRLATLIGDFQALEQAKARAAQAAKRASEELAAAEKRKAELAVLQAEAERKAKIEAQQKEIAATAAIATDNRAKALLQEAQAELDRQRARAVAETHNELDRIEADHAKRIAEIEQTCPKHEPARAAGQRVSEEWAITITDIWLLARSHPVCVKIEPLLGEIKSLLKAGVHVSGVKAEKVIKAGVTKTAGKPAIDI